MKRKIIAPFLKKISQIRINKHVIKLDNFSNKTLM